MDLNEHGVDSLYIDRVSNYSLSQLRQEPGKLKESLQKLKVETEEMSVENYTAHIDNHRCLTASMKGLNFMHNEMGTFPGKIAMVKEESKRFLENATSLVDKHKDFQSTLQKYPELLQLLEIPQLLNVCIKRQSFEDAIRLAAFVEKLVKRHAVLYGVITPEMANRRAVEQKRDQSVRNGFDLILCIFVEVQKIIQSMRAELIQTLGGTLTLPLCVKTVGYLRRVFTLINKFDAIAYLNVDHDPSSMNTNATLNVGDLKLEKIFLESRGNYLKAELAKLKQDNASEYIIQSIERRRLILCDIVSQFNAIFADYDGGTASVSASEGNESKVVSDSLHQERRLMDWIISQIDDTLKIMIKFLVMVDDGVALSNIVEQATYMARSLGKFGADFSSLLVPIFHQRAMKLASDMWEDSISQFQHNLKKIEWIKIDFKSIMKSEKSKKLEKDDTDDKDRTDSLSPPSILLQFPSLGHFANGIINSFNELRHVAFLALRDTLAVSFFALIDKLIQLVKEAKPPNTMQFRKKAMKRYKLYCNFGVNACVAHLLVLFQTIYGDKDVRFKKWFQSKAQEIHQKMDFEDIIKIELEANVSGKSNTSTSEKDGDDTMEVSASVDKDGADDGDLL